MAETLKKIKEIYGWDEEINNETEFLEYVKYRESIYEKYYDSPNLKEDYEKLKEENKKLNQEIDELTHDKQQLVTNDDICLSVVEIVGNDLPDPDNFDGDEVVSVIKSMREEVMMWRLMAKKEFGDVSVEPWYPAEVAIEIEDLKNQIPKKPRKCFSYNDKKVLDDLLIAGDPEHPDYDPDERQFLSLTTAEKKLFRRLLK